MPPKRSGFFSVFCAGMMKANSAYLLGIIYLLSDLEAVQEHLAQIMPHSCMMSPKKSGNVLQKKFKVSFEHLLHISSLCSIDLLPVITLR